MYNGVAPGRVPGRAEPSRTSRPIVFMGRVDPLKDLHTLIRAFAVVREQDAGRPGCASSAARRRATRPTGTVAATSSTSSGSPARPRSRGGSTTPVDAYHAGSIVALTSISEGFPYTVVEAMACGRPVVCTNVGGVAEAVGDAGIVVPPRDSSRSPRRASAAADDATLRRRTRRRRPASGCSSCSRSRSRWTPTATSTSGCPTPALHAPRRPAPPTGRTLTSGAVAIHRTSGGSPAPPSRPGRRCRDGHGAARPAPADHGRAKVGRLGLDDGAAGAVAWRCIPGAERPDTAPRHPADPLDELVERDAPGGRPGGRRAAGGRVAGGGRASPTGRARVEYGYADVFDLAEEVYRRAGGGRCRRPRRSARPLRDPARGLRDSPTGCSTCCPAAVPGRAGRGRRRARWCSRWCSPAGSAGCGPAGAPGWRTSCLGAAASPAAAAGCCAGATLAALPAVAAARRRWPWR